MEWRSIAKRRDKLNPHYFGVDHEIVLEAISKMFLMAKK